MRKTCLNEVYGLAQKDDRIVFIGSDLGPGVLDEMKQNMPTRFFMEGVAEQHIIGMAAGMAMEGFVPFVNTIATFLTRRCFEQVAMDLCLHDLPVRLIANGGGAVYAPLGPTHLAVEDFAILRALPNMTIVAPCDADEMKRLMPQLCDYPHPVYIRLAKGGDEVVSNPDAGFQIGKSIVMVDPKDGLFVTTGITTQLGLAAVDLLAAEGINCGVMHMHTIKPLDEDALGKYLPAMDAVVVAEEHIRSGGLGTAILELCSDTMPAHCAKIERMGIPDRFAEHYGSQDTLLEGWGITAQAMAHKMKVKLGK